MTEDAYLNHVPVATGASGRDAIRQFYAEYFIPSWPDDVRVETVSRTIGDGRLVDELLVSFTHDRDMPFWLPGVAPTGKHVTLPHVVVIGFDDGKFSYEHIYWDQASLLVKVGLLDPATLPVLGVEQARKAQDPNRPSNELIARFG
jgi:carboxymethylenebutenolidase